MSLPKINHPIFELTLPSTGETVKYRPFTVKEEKIFLIAQETKDPKQAITSIRQVINNCLVGDKGIEDLAIIDLEYILVTLRAKSVDNKIKFFIKDNETDEKVELELDVDQIEIKHDEKHQKTIPINDEYSLIMRYPSIDEFLMLLEENAISDPEVNYKIMLKCIDKLVGKDEVYRFSDFSEEEKTQFTDDLDGTVISKIKTFFETMPHMRHEIKYTNKNGKERTFVIEGIQSFFI